MARNRILLVAAIVSIAVAGCGGPMSENEYVEGLNDLVATGAPDLDASVEAYEQIANPTIEDWATFVDREIAIRQAFVDGFAALDPPASLAEVHQVLDNALDRGLASAESLVAIAETATSPAAAEQTPEYAEYVAANLEGSATACRDIQPKLDDLASSGEVFSDTPWFPSELSETVRATLGCDAFDIE